MVQNCIKHLKDERTLTVKKNLVYAIFMTHERILRVQNSMKHLQQIKEYFGPKLYQTDQRILSPKLYETFMTDQRILIVQNSTQHLWQLKEYLWSKTVFNIWKKREHLLLKTLCHIYDRWKNTYGPKLYETFMTDERILTVQNSMKHLWQMKEYLRSKTLWNIYDRWKNTYGPKLYETFMTVERIPII